MFSLVLLSTREGRLCGSPERTAQGWQRAAVTREIHEQGRPIAFICYAGWICISARILKGKKATGTVGIKDDMINAGAEWIDRELVIDGNLISSRKPKDLHVFSKGPVDRLKA